MELCEPLGEFVALAQRAGNAAEAEAARRPRGVAGLKQWRAPHGLMEFIHVYTNKMV